VQPADDPAGRELKGGVETACAVPFVVMGRALEDSGSHWQDRRGPIERLEPCTNSYMMYAAFCVMLEITMGTRRAVCRQPLLTRVVARLSPPQIVKSSWGFVARNNPDYSACWRMSVALL
jgi:hypothetical protein